MDMNYWKSGVAALIESGLSVTEIADASGLSVSGVYDLKNGYTKEPRGMAAVRINKMIQALGNVAEKPLESGQQPETAP